LAEAEHRAAGLTAIMDVSRKRSTSTGKIGETNPPCDQHATRASDSRVLAAALSSAFGFDTEQRHTEVARPPQMRRDKQVPHVLHQSRVEIAGTARAWSWRDRRAPSPHRDGRARPVVIGTTATPTSFEAARHRAGLVMSPSSTAIASSGQSRDRGRQQGGFPGAGLLIR